jgi:glycerol-3-phosphate acyltransferase PlsY
MILFSLLSIIGAYLIGALPSGVWLARLYGVEDITQHGSGNSGATNVARILGTYFFIPVFLLDAGKAWLWLSFNAWLGLPLIWLCLCALTLLLGNCYSLFLAGKGGKGIATAIGIIVALQPILIIPLLGIWLLVLAITRTVGMASVIAAAMLPYCSFRLGHSSWQLCLLFVIIAALCIKRHERNLFAYISKRIAA